MVSVYDIGIDNGLKGAIVVLDKDRNIVDKMVMPTIGKSSKEYDIMAIFNFLKKYRNGHVILEKSQPQFRDGRKQAFKTGYGYGVMQGILTALEISFEIIAPIQWQRRIFRGMDSSDTKTASALFCIRKWPSEDWKATIRCTKVQDGLTDAACMAFYGAIR